MARTNPHTRCATLSRSRRPTSHYTIPCHLRPLGSRRGDLVCPLCDIQNVPEEEGSEEGKDARLYQAVERAKQSGKKRIRVRSKHPKHRSDRPSPHVHLSSSWLQCPTATTAIFIFKYPPGVSTCAYLSVESFLFQQTYPPSSPTTFLPRDKLSSDWHVKTACVSTRLGCRQSSRLQDYFVPYSQNVL